MAGHVLESAGPPSGRVDAVDFWRGIVLVAILCDHIPGNLIEKATPRNFALSDSAEAFVFLSGVSGRAGPLSTSSASGLAGPDQTLLCARFRHLWRAY